jgi:hypothetical protein
VNAHGLHLDQVYREINITNSGRIFAYLALVCLQGDSEESIRENVRKTVEAYSNWLVHFLLNLCGERLPCCGKRLPPISLRNVFRKVRCISACCGGNIVIQASDILMAEKYLSFAMTIQNVPQALARRFNLPGS